MGRHDEAEIGRRLAQAAGYRVFDQDNHDVGTLDHVRYERRFDRPDEVVVRQGRLFARQRTIPFEDVAAVKPRERTVVLRLDRQAVERLPSRRLR